MWVAARRCLTFVQLTGESFIGSAVQADLWAETVQVRHLEGALEPHPRPAEEAGSDFSS